MRDLTHKHILSFVLLFVTLFAVLFAGVVQVHKRNMQRPATAHYTPAAAMTAPAHQ
jgi:hypothetical protein